MPLWPLLLFRFALLGIVADATLRMKEEVMYSLCSLAFALLWVRVLVFVSHISTRKSRIPRQPKQLGVEEEQVGVDAHIVVIV